MVRFPVVGAGFEAESGTIPFAGAMLESSAAIQIDPLNPIFGAKLDATHVTDAVVSGSTVSSAAASALWQANSPVGKTFLLSDQGASNAADLRGTITAFDNVQTVTLSVAPAGGATGQLFAWGTDDTAAWDQSIFPLHAANPGSVIKLPGDRASMYNGLGVSSTDPAIVAPALNRPQFYLGPSSSLVASPTSSPGVPEALSSLHLQNVFTFGGMHPLVRLTWPGVNSSFSRYVVENCRVEYFRGTAVSSLASDHPYWKINLMARNPLSERGIAVALAGYTDACDIKIDCIAVNGLKVGRGGNSCVLHDSSWIFHTYAGTPRWCVWHTPETTSVNSGRGFLGHSLRFGNEGYNNADFRILIADEDIDTGADFASRTPLWTPSMVNTPTTTTVSGTNSSGSGTLNVAAGTFAAGMTVLVGTGGSREAVTIAASYVSGTALPLTGTLAHTHSNGERVLGGFSGWISGVKYRDCLVVGSGNTTTGPVIYSTAGGNSTVSGNVGGSSFQDFTLNSTPPAIAFQFLTVGQGGFANTNALIDWKTAGAIGRFTQRAIASNDPQVYVRDPQGVFSTPTVSIPGGAERTNYVKLLATRLRSFTLTSAGSTTLTAILDDRMQSNGAELNLQAVFDSCYAPLTNVVANTPIWIEFAIQQAASGSLPQVLVTLESTNALPTIDQWIITVPASWQSFRLMHMGIPTGAIPSPLYLRFKIITAMTTGKFQLSRPRVYHGVEPVGPLHAYPVQAISPVSGWYFQPQYVVQTPVVPGVGNLNVCPVFISEDCTLAQMFAEFTAAGSADSTIIPCVFNDNGSFAPSDLICQAQSISTGTGDAGTVATGGTPGIYFANVTQALKAGLYWVGSVQQGTTGATMRMGVWGPGGFGRSTAPAANVTTSAYTQSGVTGSLPALPSNTFTAPPSAVAQAARIGLKFA